jgi:hypothetical protein
MEVLCIGFVRDDGEQIRNAHIVAGLKQQRACLSAVVRLMVEKMHHKTGKALIRHNAFHVRVAQDALQVLFGKRRGPLLDNVVQEFAMIGERNEICKQNLI